MSARAPLQSRFSGSAGRLPMRYSELAAGALGAPAPRSRNHGHHNDDSNGFVADWLSVERASISFRKLLNFVHVPEAPARSRRSRLGAKSSLRAYSQARPCRPRCVPPSLP
jgi:hypothetical protein